MNLSQNYSMELDANLFMKSLRSQQRSQKSTPRGRNNKLACSKDGLTQKSLYSQSQSRDVGGAQKSKGNNTMRRLKSASKLMSEESAEQIVQRGLEGTKKLIQQLQQSQKRNKDGDKTSQNQNGDLKNYNWMDMGQMNNSNR